MPSNKGEKDTQDRQHDNRKKDKDQDHDNRGRKNEKVKKDKHRDGSDGSRESHHSDRRHDSRDVSPRESRQKEYFREELRRIQDSLEREAAKIVEPEKKDFTPDIFNSLEPYFNTDAPQFLIELPEQVRQGYQSRQTAIGICDPWVSHKMDVALLPKIDSKFVTVEDSKSKGIPRDGGSSRRQKGDDNDEHRKKSRDKKQDDQDYSDDPEYKRTKEDFYRMELNKINEYHPKARPKMKAAYVAYLQNTPGSKKAVQECLREIEEQEKEEKERKEREKAEKKQKDDKSKIDHKDDKEHKDSSDRKDKKGHKNKKEHHDNRDNQNRKSRSDKSKK